MICELLGELGGDRGVELLRRIDGGRAVAAHLRRDHHEVDVVRVVRALVQRVGGRALEVALVDRHRLLVDVERTRGTGRPGSRCAPACGRCAPRPVSARPGARACGSARSGVRRCLHGMDVEVDCAGMVRVALQHRLEVETISSPRPLAFTPPGPQ